MLTMSHCGRPIADGRSGLNEPALIGFYFSSQPIRMGSCADKSKNRGRRYLARDAGSVVCDLDSFKLAAPRQTRDLRVQEHFYVGRLVAGPGVIPRHALFD